MKALTCCGYCAAVAVFGFGGQPGKNQPTQPAHRRLPPPARSGIMSLEEAIAARRSIRDFSKKALGPEEIAQLCWAAQGITDPGGEYRTAPSAGALYPIELYVVTPDGVEHYLPADHALRRHAAGDLRRQLQRASLDQEPVGDAPVCFVIAAVVQRTAQKYGNRAERYCFIEAGHVAQNILLQAAAMHLGGVPVGAYEDADVAKVLSLPKDQRVLYLVPIGRPRH